MLKDKTVEKRPTSAFKVKSSTIRMFNAKPSISRVTHESFFDIEHFYSLIIDQEEQDIDNAIFTLQKLICSSKEKD